MLWLSRRRPIDRAPIGTDRLDDETIRRNAANGGVLALHFLEGYVQPRHTEHATIEHLVDEIDHIKKVAGIEFRGPGPRLLAHERVEVDRRCRKLCRDAERCARDGATRLHGRGDRESARTKSHARLSERLDEIESRPGKW